MAKNISVKMTLEGTEEIRAQLDGVRAATEGMGDEGVQNANQLVGAMENIAKQADSIATKIANGKSVSDTSLNGMRESYVALQSAITGAFGSIEKAPESVQKAFRETETVIGRSATRVREAGEAARTAGQRFEELAGAVKGVPEQVDKIPVAADRAQRFLDEFWRKLEVEADIGKGDIEKVERAMILLEDEIKKSGKTIDDLDPKFKQTYGSLKSQTEEARSTLQRFETQLDQLAPKSDSLAKGFTGVGDALQQMGGKAGAAATQVGLVAAAFDQGWQSGMRFNQMAGTNTREMESVFASFGQRVGVMISGVSDLIIKEGELFGALWESIKTKSLDPLRKAGDELAATTKSTYENTKVAISGTADEVDRIAVSYGLMDEKTRRAAEAQQQMVVAQQQAAAATQDAAAEITAASAQTAAATDAAAESQYKWVSQVVGWKDAAGRMHIEQRAVREETEKSVSVMDAAIQKTGLANATTEQQVEVTEKATEALDDMAKRWQAIDISGLANNLELVSRMLEKIIEYAPKAADAIEELSGAGDDGISISRTDGSAIQPGSLSGGTFRNPGDSRSINLGGR